MDWALKYNGQLVRAVRETFSSFDLVCPSCGEPVHIRRGKTRRAHFAHYSNRAKPDCELYYPSPEALRLSGYRSTHTSANLYPRENSIRSGLFIASKPGDAGFELYVRLPSIGSTSLLSGKIEVQHVMGVKVLSAAQLSNSRRIPLVPSVPLMVCNGTGDLSALAEHIAAEAELFNSSINIFSVSERHGRLLSEYEPLEWGGQYWVIGKDPVIPPESINTHIDWSVQGSIANWCVYEMVLPYTRSSALLTSIRDTINSFFGRRIKTCRPKLRIVEPLPHHYGEDGAYVYPLIELNLYLRRSSEHEVTIEGPHEQIQDAKIHLLSEGWVHITSIKPGEQEISILIDGYEQVILRFDECDLIRPEGIKAVLGNETWNLVTEIHVTTDCMMSNEITLTCSTERLAYYAARHCNDAKQDGKYVTLEEGATKEVSLGGFGELFEAKRFEELGVGCASDTYTDHNRDALVSWLESIMLQQYGINAMLSCRRYINDPCNENLKGLGLLMTSPLFVYVKNVAEQNKH